MIGEYNKEFALPLTAASAITPFQTVVLDTGSAKRQAVPVATNNVEPLGLISSGTALQGEAVTVYTPGAVVEAVSVASVGAGADVGVASSNGALGLVTGASGVTKFRVGRTLEPAGAGERFSLYVHPKQLSNLI